MSTRGFVLKGLLFTSYTLVIGSTLYSCFDSKNTEQKNAKNPQPSLFADAASFLVDTGLNIALATGATFIITKATNVAVDACCKAKNAAVNYDYQNLGRKFSFAYWMGWGENDYSEAEGIPNKRKGLGYRFMQNALDVTRACNYSMAPAIILRYIPAVGTYSGVAIGKGLFLFTPATAITIIIGVGAAEYQKYREERNGKKAITAWDFAVPIFFGMTLSSVVNAVSVRNAKGAAQIVGEAFGKLPLALTPLKEIIAPHATALLARIASCGQSSSSNDNRKCCESVSCDCCKVTIQVVKNEHHHHNSVSNFASTPG